MRNPFTPKTRELFTWNYACWECGRNSGLELHHIMKRISNSPLNAAPLCHKCHAPESRNTPIHSDENSSKYLKKTLAYLLSNGYVLNKVDREFMLENKHLYL